VTKLISFLDDYYLLIQGSIKNMEREHVYLRLNNTKLLSYKSLEDGTIIGTGILNPLIDKVSIIMMLIIQAGFYSAYKNLARWRGYRVGNTFAPPVGSRPQYRALIGLVKTNVLKRAFPVAMTFAVTYKCQCKCIHCSAGKFARNGMAELSTKEAKRVIDESQKLGVTIIAFTGGEPLLREDIFELISYVDKKKAMPIMFTNGQYLTEKNVQKLHDSGLYSLFVSIDSHIPEDHDRFRGVSGLHKSAIEGIKRAKEKGIMVGFSSYATRTNANHEVYKELYKLAQELKLHNFILFDGVPTGNMLKNMGEMLTPDQREEIRRFSSDIFKDKKVPPLSSQSWQNSIEANLAGIGCLAGNIQFYVSAYGDVTPCDFTPLSFGNVRKESLKKIWNRMVSHPAYDHKSSFCRMQNEKFRQCYIDQIPGDITLPYPVSKLPLIDYRKI
jgi:MoaA/NifB/PqqE/SkfB family radical SAM enzyme